MELEERRYGIEEWDKVVDAVETGELVDCSKDLSEGFLMVGQTFRGLLKDKKGKVFYCSGWGSSCGRVPHVYVQEHRP